MIKIYTLGYEGIEPGQFIRKLKENSVDLLVDVRDLPASRKKGFSKRSLSEMLELHGIAYRHISELGSPADLRHKFIADGDWDYFSEQFKSGHEKRQPFLEELAASAPNEATCLMCYEANPQTCHRSLVAEELLDRLNGRAQVIHIT